MMHISMQVLAHYLAIIAFNLVLSLITGFSILMETKGPPHHLCIS